MFSDLSYQRRFERYLLKIMSDKSQSVEPRPETPVRIQSQRGKEFLYQLTRMFMDFTASVFKHNPTDYVDYAANYFAARRTTTGDEMSSELPSPPKTPAEIESERGIDFRFEFLAMFFDFTVSVLTHNPTDLEDYAADYFAAQRTTRNETSCEQPEQSSSLDASERNTQVREATTQTEADTTEMEANTHEVPGVSAMSASLETRCGFRISGRKEQDDIYEVESYDKTVEQREMIRQRIADDFLFRFLDEADMEAVIDAMMPRPVRSCEVVISQGDCAYYCYFIERGSYDVFISQAGKKQRYVETYEGRGCFGERALMHNEPQSATIIATCNGFLWAVSRLAFRNLVVKRTHDKKQAIVDLLNTVPGLKPLSNDERMKVCDGLKPVSFQPDKVIFNQGDQADGMYFIVDGTVAIAGKSTKKKKQVELCKGEYFGELALVERKPRAVTATATTNVKLVFLDRVAFERVSGT